MEEFGMKDKDCIFCKIANGEIPSATIYEDEDFRVILDLGPASRGHALILPKEHFKDVCELDEKVAARVLPLAAKIGAAMKEALKLSVRFLAGGALPLIPYVIALAGVIALCYVVPPLILVVPAGYCYSLSNYMEQLLNAYMEENVCEEANAPDWLQSEAQES